MRYLTLCTSIVWMACTTPIDPEEVYANMNALTELDVETAKVLANYDGGRLKLDGLTQLDATTAEALARYPGEQISLNGLKFLDLETAKSLMEFRWDYKFEGLESLEPSVAAVLATSRGTGMYLGMTNLDEQTATELSQFGGGYLAFPRLQSLEPATAKALTQFNGWTLSFSGLTELTADTATMLADWDSKKHSDISLNFDGLSHLDAATATALAKFQGYQISLKGLNTVNVDVARALATFSGRDLELKLKEIEYDAAVSLIQYSGRIHFESIVNPNPELQALIVAYNERYAEQDQMMEAFRENVMSLVPDEVKNKDSNSK